MVKERKYLSTLIDRFIPEFIRDYYPNFVVFIKKYFEELEQEGNVYELLSNLPSFIDVDKTKEELLNEFILQYLPDFPIEDEHLNDKINKRFFIKNIKEFYKNKGNETSAKFIFNLLNQKIEIYYPKEKILLLDDKTFQLNNVNSRIHDNYYYAYYVYEIESDLNVDEWRNIAKSTFHSAGMKFFGLRKIYLMDDDKLLSFKDWKDCSSQEFINDNLIDTNTGYLTIYSDFGIEKQKDYNIVCSFKELELISSSLKSYFILNKFQSTLDGNEGNQLPAVLQEDYDILQSLYEVYTSFTLEEMYDLRRVDVILIQDFTACGSQFWDLYDFRNFELSFFENNTNPFNFQKESIVEIEVLA